jgi:hypothetical protein
MPRFDLALLGHVHTALDFARAGERARSSGPPAVRRHWTPSRLDAMYELAFVRIFVAWEMCLESIVHRSLCGYASRRGRETIIPQPNFTLLGGYYRTIADAEVAFLEGRDFVIWHNPVRMANLCNRHIQPYSPVASHCIGLQASILDSYTSTLTDYVSIRNRIVHGQRDARNKFDAASRSIARKTYPGSIPGKLLRDRDPTRHPPATYIEIIASDLVSLAGQMV